MRKFLIPIAAIAASTVALAAPASASPRWAGNGYSSGYAMGMGQYRYDQRMERRMARFDRRMDRRMMRSHGVRGYGWNAGYGVDRDRDGRDDRYENSRGWNPSH